MGYVPSGIGENHPLKGEVKLRIMESNSQGNGEPTFGKSFLGGSEI